MLNKKGQSILEVILALAIFSLIAAAMVTMLTGSFTSLNQGGEQTEAELLAQEVIEAVKSIRDGAWNEIIYTTSSVSISGNEWVFDGEGLTDTVGKYTRTLSFADVCRDVSDDISSCPANYTDLHSKQVTATVQWNTTQGKSNTVQQITYITNWDSQDWTQTDWSGGSGQSVWSDITMYDSDDGNVDYATGGEIKLASLGGDACGTKIWPFTTPANYSYDIADIQVSSGLASLLDQGGAGSCGGTPDACSTFGSDATCTAQTGCSWATGSSGSSTNAGFDTNTNGWTFSEWLTSGGVTQTGNHVASGGNTGGYANITIDAKKGQTLAGVWEQSFTTTVNNPSTATLDLDWFIDTYDSTKVNSFRVYAFVDSVSGDPSVGQQVWDSGEITGTTPWTSISQVDLTSELAVAGTYYVKFAVWVDFAGGGGANPSDQVVGFDNVVVNWSGSDSCNGTPNACNTFGTEGACTGQSGCSWNAGVSYPTDNPTINPTASYTISNLDTWTSFSETASKDGGEIYYQLSDDDGSTWQYWNGSSWTTAGASNYNTATDVNTNISSFSTSSGQIMFQAFLESDGSQLVELDEISVSCEQYYDWPFTTPANYTYNSSDLEVTGGLASLLDQGGAGSCNGTPNACNTFATEGACTAQTGCSWATGSSGSSTNAGFDSGITNWTYNDWDEGGGEVDATGAYQSSSGNPGGWININVPTGRNDELGGYWEQSFTTTADSPSATIDFDWQVVSYDATPNSFQLYVFVDSATGEPTIGQQVWASGELSATQGWTSASTVDISASLPTAGTYYIKVAVWVDTANSNTGPFTVGYDNVSLSWSTANSCNGTPNACNTFGTEGACTGQSGCSWSAGVSYPTDNPTINPTASYTISNLDTWTSFSETASKDGGEIYYQLSDDDGSTWQYWDGGSWTTAGGSNYNIATDVNTNISSFSTSSGQIMFQAFLESDGSQLVELDNVRLGWGEGTGASGYQTSAYFVSSAYDMGNNSPVQILEWDDTQPTGTDIQLQIRTAPDSSGSPGTWTNWYGVGGSGTYFTSPTGTIISTDLNGNQWVQYRAELTGDSTDTPVLQEVRVNYK